MKPPRLSFVQAAVLGLATLSAAAEPPVIAACQACHGRDGISSAGHIPNLAGQKKDYLAKQLEAFKSGERKNDLMAAIAAQLSDADIAALALAWSQTTGGAPAATAPAIPSRMAFPAAFPQGFTLYETVDGPPLVKRYANDTALRAARAGQPLPHGAVIVVATYGADGAAVSYAGMASAAGWGAGVPALLRNGNWDYALFGADGTRRDSVNQAPCLACHKPLAADSFVFTMKALRAAAAAR
jgi:cytochrome c553